MTEYQALIERHRLLSEVQQDLGKSDAEYTSILAWAVEKLGIRLFSYVYIDGSMSNCGRPVIIGNYPREWVETYVKNKMHKKDPVIRRSSSVSVPFSWDEKIDQSSNSSIFNLSKKYGIEQGFSVPVHDPGSAFGSMHFASDGNSINFKRNVSKNKYIISCLSYLAHLYRPVEARQKNYRQLTDREIECLRWVAIGKTYSEIGLILDISERTVKFHTQNIMRKMNTVNMKQAVAEALRMNII